MYNMFVFGKCNFLFLVHVIASVEKRSAAIYNKDCFVVPPRNDEMDEK